MAVVINSREDALLYISYCLVVRRKLMNSDLLDLGFLVLFSVFMNFLVAGLNLKSVKSQIMCPAFFD